VLTGQPPYRKVKSRELSYHVSLGLRPEKPANAKKIGISDPLWQLIQRCWDGERTRRPQIQKVLKGVGDAAADWGKDMPPSSPEEQEESDVEEDSDPLEHREITLPMSF
jgi:hypothetical protein